MSDFDLDAVQKLASDAREQLERVLVSSVKKLMDSLDVQKLLELTEKQPGFAGWSRTYVVLLSTELGPIEVSRRLTLAEAREDVRKILQGDDIRKKSLQIVQEVCTRFNEEAEA